MLYEAVLMDMDGVVIDTQQSIVAFWQQLAAKYNIYLTQEDIDRDISGCSAQHTIISLFPHLDIQGQQSIYRALHDYEASLHYQEVSGAIALLRALKYYHIPVALVTGAGRWKVGVVVQQLGLEPFLTVQVTGDDVQESKPSPDGYLLAAYRLGKEPRSCIVFEDAVNGILAALTAQTVCIGVQTTASASSLLAAGAYCIIPDFNAVRIQETSSEINGSDACLQMGISIDFSLPLKSL